MSFYMPIPVAVEEMLDRLHKNGYTAYLVGGCVRDALLGLTPHDYDITTNARPEEITALFGKEQCTFYGRAFGTVGVKLKNGFAEITTFRTEGDYTDSRHPGMVTFADDVMDDLSRRDFTCNAIAYNPESGLLDPYHGADDLQAGILRCVGVPLARFREDALRILRGMRFYARFGLVPEPLTDAAMRAAAFRLVHISAERIFTELCGMLMGAHVTEVLLLYPEILAVRIPEIRPCIAFSQHSRYHDFTVWGHIARAVGNAAPDLTVRLTMLLHDLAKPCCYKSDVRGGHFKTHAERGSMMADEILRRLRCDNHLRERVKRLIFWHRETPVTMPAVRRMLGVMGEEEFCLFLQVLEADRISKHLSTPESRDKLNIAEQLLTACLEQHLCCTVGSLAISGRDLIEIGLQGHEIGDSLRFLLEEVIEERIANEKMALLDACQKYF